MNETLIRWIAMASFCDRFQNHTYTGKEEFWKEVICELARMLVEATVPVQS